MGKPVSRVWSSLLATAAFVGLLSIAAPASALSPRAPEKADLVFSSGGRIVSMKADGSERKVLTREGLPFDSIYQNEDDAPQISPDGSAIAFSRYTESRDFETSSQIITVDREGGSENVLVSGATGDEFVGSPAWSRDSSRIYFIRILERGNRITADVRSVAPGGTGNRLISRSVMRFGKKKIFGSRSLPFDVVPSPSGKELLVSYYPIYGDKPADAFLMDPESGKRRLLERDAGGGDWSPDGSRIVFISERDRLNKSCYEDSCSYDPQAFVMKRNGSAVRRLVPGKPRGSTWEVDWSADGRRIAFSSDRIAPNRHVSGEVFSIGPAGKCLTRLTNGSPASGAAAWGPGKALSSDPGTCGDAAPRALAEYEPDSHVLALKNEPLWLGSSFGNTLLNSIFKDGRAVSTDYSDCGALRSNRCARPVALDSGPVCEKASDSVFYDGTFDRLVERNGALVMLATASGGGLESIAFSGGVEAGIYTRSTFRGKKVTQAEHLRLAGLLRPVSSTGPVDSLEPPVFTLSEVRKARAVLVSWRDRGTLAEAAEEQKMFPRMAAAYLRFGKALDRIGKVLTVKCRGRMNVPGSEKLR